MSPQQQADEFNAKISPGDWVHYWEVKGEGPGQIFQTKTSARVLEGHTAVVWLEGKSGCVCCDHCEKVNADTAKQTAKPPAAKAEAVEATAATLEQANREWRTAMGYTGTPVHKPEYWKHLATFLIDHPPA